MLENIKGLRWIGDLSLEDADIIAGYAKRSKHILEFGSGGSTQIFAQCGAKSVTSIETDQNWIDRTQARLKQLPNATPVEFHNYKTSFDQVYDLIFVDGIYQLREEFAHAAWHNLNHINGVMIFHDTRRWWDAGFALDTAKKFYIEVGNIEVNAKASNGRSSNVTVLHKKFAEPYENWNLTENKPHWAYGGVPDTDDHPLWQYNATV